MKKKLLKKNSSNEPLLKVENVETFQMGKIKKNFLKTFWKPTMGNTVEKKAGFNFFPCGQISLCPCQTLMSNDIRMTFSLLIDLARSDLFRVKVMGFSGVQK